MKVKTAALGAALAFPMIVHAQSATNVTLYGIVDTAIEYLNNIPEFGTMEVPDGNGGTRIVPDYANQIGSHSSTHFTNLTASVPSRWGLRGSEDLGDGLTAIFTL